jgi:phosphate starvation-inducible PhoH-like protein
LTDKPMAEEIIPFQKTEIIRTLAGSFDANLKLLEEETHTRIRLEENSIHISGEEQQTRVSASVLHKLVDMAENNEPIDRSRVRYAIALAQEGNADAISDIMRGTILVTYRGKAIKCRTFGQKKYVEAMRKNPVVFGIGPAGTGKTYLAMAMALLSLKNKEVSRIVLTRPAVEAGEKLGFLPGDLQNKVDPYLRPLYDAIYEMIGMESYSKLQEKGVIEVAPMAYMRGRTLNDSYIILDEAQNATSEQMKMFLTRMGQGSRMIITGDITQIDLPSEKTSGLIEASRILRDIPGIEICTLTAKDVVRHELVQAIIGAYEKHQQRKR